MAKIEVLHPTSEGSPAYAETIEVRPWDLGGTPDQRFLIGSGLNFVAEGNILIEIIYTVAGAQVLYTRSILHTGRGQDRSRQRKQLDEILQAGEGQFGFGDMLPETSIRLKAEISSYKDGNEEEHIYSHCKLVISADAGAVFGHTSPGERLIEIAFPFIDLDEGVRFMRDLVDEIAALYKGRRPNPADLPPGSSEWPFVWQLNRPAYNRIARAYREAYFENPLLTETFDGWLARLPPGGQVLDTGCGHGEPVIARLLEKGFRVTGADFSPEMLSLARQNHPGANFVKLSSTQLAYEAEFDGACSFSSLLYLDPVDFHHAVYRLHCALKPGGLLFLYALDLGPDWRGMPFNVVIGEWMWSWHYGMEETARRLEEHGYFETIEMKRVAVDEDKERGYLKKVEDLRLEREAAERERERDPGTFRLPSFGYPPDRPGYAYVVIARRTKRKRAKHRR